MDGIPRFMLMLVHRMSDTSWPSIYATHFSFSPSKAGGLLPTIHRRIVARRNESKYVNRIAA
jgi:hypothetical protein